MEGDESAGKLDNRCTREENRRSLIQQCVGEVDERMKNEGRYKN
jgi:hypothetical protein